MARKNPPLLESAVLPIVPYAIGGAILFFYGKDIINWIGAKISGVSPAQFKEDVKAVAATTAGAVKATANVIGTVEAAPLQFGLWAWNSALQPGYNVTPAKNTAAINAIKEEKGIIAPGVKVPYPKPGSQAEFRANIAAISGYLTAKKNPGK
jgi:hypothetical protein